MSTIHQWRLAYCSATTIFKYGTLESAWPLYNTLVSRQESSEPEDDSLYRVKLHGTKTTFCFTATIASMLQWNIWVTISLQCTAHLSCARGLRRSATTYQGRGWDKPPSTTTLVRNEFNLPKANDAEATVSTYVCNDEELYQPTTFGFEKKDELPS